MYREGTQETFEAGLEHERSPFLFFVFLLFFFELGSLLCCPGWP